MRKGHRFNSKNDSPSELENSSDDELSDEEVRLAIKGIGKKSETADTNNELMAFDSNDTESDAESLASSDVNDELPSEDDLPDRKNWGSESRSYYHTDFVDKDYSTYNEQEEELAMQEEEEAKQIQLRMANEMQNNDFFLDENEMSIINNTVGDGHADLGEKTLVRVDLTNLTDRETLKLLSKDSPELMRLISELFNVLKESKSLIFQLDGIDKKLLALPALQFAVMYRNLCNTYCSNVLFYLLLKIKRLPIRSHPVTRHLVQMTSLIQQLTLAYHTKCKPHLAQISEFILQNNLAIEHLLSSVRKKLHDDKIESQIDETTNENEENKLESDCEQQDSEMHRRSITYEMANNKGLVTHRKKEQRNPRVKHRAKFRKALVRRKGAVRTVQKELNRYGGEIFGIKASVTKSVRFKS